ncbi:galactarate dehydratase [Amphibiibacter pelophylacis]|uniref:Galactarate dehydratase n=1 Tax=Amphibiibacter pelophylacis TaxID=1799477 RepID=A0ACC6P1B0_9BURK
MNQRANDPIILKIHNDDNVAIVANDGGLPSGTVIKPGLVLQDGVPQGHKFTLVPVAQGEAVVRYGVAIGYATENLTTGCWVKDSLMSMPSPPELERLPSGGRCRGIPAPLSGYTFEGYRNTDGSVGTRNILAISTTVQCVAGVVEHALSRIRSELLPLYPHVDDVVAIEHTYGCGVAIDAPGADIPIRTLRNIVLNPNFGGEVLLISLGCEKLQPDRLLPAGAIPVASDSRVVLQDDCHIGFEAMIEHILLLAREKLERLNRRRRVTCPASDLVVGVQCGGSDAFSGITANPAVGYVSDLIVRSGGTVMFSEVTEVRDGIAQLLARAATPEVAQALRHEMAWYDTYLQRGGVDRSANTTPGNKKGGLNNIVEKAMGSIVKSGVSDIVGVVSPGEKVTVRGLNYTATPASDFICGTLQMAAGMNIHVFTTGRGTPYGLAAVPVVKVATRSDLARRWHDLMDVNAGTIATGEKTVEEVGWEMFHFLLDVASGRRKTWAEHWKIHNALALFNPAPVT